MKNFWFTMLLSGLLFGTPLAGVSAATNTVTSALKVELQSALLTFLEQGGDADGTFRILDRKTGEMTQTHIGALHPKVIRVGPDFVLCIEMFDNLGQRHEADFVMRQGTAGWLVTDVLCDQRDLLKKARQQN